MKELMKKLFFLPMSIINKINLQLHKAVIGRGFICNGRLRINGKGILKIGIGVRINSCYRFNPIGGNTFTGIYIRSGACVKIGDNTGISNTAIYAAERIEIGDNCKIGGNVSIYDTDFHSVNYLERRKKPEPFGNAEPVYIGDDVFIGAHSIILKGVKIGDRSIIGAGSVVTKDVPTDEIWAGVPAMFVRKLGDNRC